MEAFVINCGGFQRRKADERNYQPCVGLLYSDGTIKRKKLDCSEEKWLDNAEQAEALAGGSSAEFIAELEQLGDAALDYAEAVRRRVNQKGVGERTKAAVLRCLEDSDAT